MRRRQNNPILTGEAGVGKTAVVEGFAQRLAAGDVPPSLRGVKLCSLDIGLMQAGASMKGEFEQRLRSELDAGGLALGFMMIPIITPSPQTIARVFPTFAAVCKYEPRPGKRKSRFPSVNISQAIRKNQPPATDIIEFHTSPMIE